MKILFIQNRMLLPANTGGKIRSYNILKHLAQWHKITYLCNLLPGEERYESELEGLGLRIRTVPWSPSPHGGFGFYRDIAINLFSRIPFNIARHFSPALRSRAHEVVAEESSDLIICDFLQSAKHVIDITSCPRILFQHNVEAQILERLARASKGSRAWYMKQQSRRMRHFESKCGARFDGVIAVSENDKQKFEQDYGWDRVYAIDTGVDVDFFRPDDDVEEQEGSILFVGSMDWIPNQDGVRYFLHEIWPLVRDKRPGATFQVVGRNPPADLVRRSGHDGIEVTGTVPDIRPYLARAAVFVVPLLAGGGTRLKIFEAMAMRKAIVSTTVGAEGLPVSNGEHLLLEDTPADVAAAVIRLLDSTDERARLADSSSRLVVQRFKTEVVARQFDEICCFVAQKPTRQNTYTDTEKV